MTSQWPKPALPPRQSISLQHEAPPAYRAVAVDKNSIPEAVLWSGRDPRASSQHSLVPSESNEQNERRKLLLIFIHGFMGNETSFRSFPAHVHRLLTVLLANTHVVHTKLYPRYRSKRNISFARDDFSTWLEPHEDTTTDVVFLGHSMGGLLSSEVVLKPTSSPANRPLKHRILGTINFDVPFLGMHPGVVKSGLASIFKPPEESVDKFAPGFEQDSSQFAAASNSSSPDAHTPQRVSAVGSPNLQDPNFNTPFVNDVVLPVRKGWESAWHFISKHSSDLKGATKQLVSSHMEFGGAMANYAELKSRYGRVRILEESDVNVRKSTMTGGGAPPRVRFINYYTASTGRVKKVKPSGGAEKQVSHLCESTSSLPSTSAASSSERVDQSPFKDDLIVEEALVPEEDSEGRREDWETAAEYMTITDSSSVLTMLDPAPEADYETLECTPESRSVAQTLSPTSTMSSSVISSFGSTSLPPIADLPAPPPPLDVSFIQDADTRKIVQREHARAVKAYEKSVKDREKAIQERSKLERKREKEAQKLADKAEKDAAKSRNDVKQPDRELTHSEKEALRMQAEKQRMDAEARRMRGEKQEEEDDGQRKAESVQSSRTEPSNVHSPAGFVHDETPCQDEMERGNDNAKTKSAETKPVKDRMFCSLPPKDANGQLDPCWVRIFMQDVDEVGAHCGLFFIDERYERLVGEVAERIERWVKEDMNERAILGELSEAID